MTIIVITAANTTKPPNTPSAMMPPMFSLAADFEPCRTELLSAISLSNGFRCVFLVGFSLGRFVDELMPLTLVGSLVLVDE